MPLPARTPRTEPSAKQNWTVPACVLLKWYQNDGTVALPWFRGPPPVGRQAKPIQLPAYCTGLVARVGFCQSCEPPVPSPNISTLLVPSGIRSIEFSERLVKIPSNLPIPEIVPANWLLVPLPQNPETPP